MKKLSLFFCLLLALMTTFQACNNEDEATPAPEDESTEVVNPTTGKIWMDRNLGAS